MKKIIVVLLLITTFSCVSNKGYYEKDDILYHDNTPVTSVSFQINSDIKRLQHLEYYTRLIQEYYERKGKYPFQSNKPVYIYIANNKQYPFVKDYDSAIPYDHNTISYADFVNEIESVLEIKMDEYYDPQYAPDIKPNWYLYATMNENFYFAVHVHQSFKFSKELGPYYNKIEISNSPNYGHNLILTPKDLLSSPDFNEALKTKIDKEDFFTEREKLHISETKK